MYKKRVYLKGCVSSGEGVSSFYLWLWRLQLPAAAAAEPGHSLWGAPWPGPDGQRDPLSGLEISTSAEITPASNRSGCQPSLTACHKCNDDKLYDSSSEESGCRLDRRVCPGHSRRNTQTHVWLKDSNNHELDICSRTVDNVHVWSGKQALTNMKSEEWIIDSS